MTTSITTNFIPAQAAVQPGGMSVDQVISPFIGVFIAAFLVSLAATPLMRTLARKNGIVDKPDLARKLHREPIPYLGGVAIFLGWIAGMTACLLAYRYNDAGQIERLVNIPISIVFGAGVITLVGLFDDVYGSSPRVKLGGQLLAAAALASEKVGFMLVTQLLAVCGITNPPFMLCYIAGAALIAIFVLGGTNAMNLIDGLDGLAAGSAAIMNVGFLAIAVYAMIGTAMADPELTGSDPVADPVRIVLCLAALGAVLGFLPYNFNPASIFMGDAGSLLLGFLAVATILSFAHSSSKGPGLVLAGLIVFALPIIDTTLAIIRRKMRGVSISVADKNHLHHQLLRFWQRFNFGPGASVKMTALSLYAVGLALAIFGVLVAVVRVRYSIALSMVFFGFLFVAAYKSGRRIVEMEKKAELAEQAELLKSDPAP
ncbi:MAG: undecaprenyl/decaprenyl-phosphate alpha-N-acetylglucosaminyl 1-phosphate transferase [Phycisphaerales bacterium]|nr:undecaprenyl/decaprenyl-phosphate alpha-N-acetylglucosaminyl 1-phosphate transferase [Phycisphaerales bacterium]